MLGVYAVGSFGALEVVDFLVEAAGLPGWFPTFAVALLVVGLPIVVGTAIVQEGVPRGSEESEAAGASGEASGLDPTSPPTGEGAGGIRALLILALAGEVESALERIEILLEEPSIFSPAGVRLEPAFEGLRDHPRFVELAGRG